MRRATIRRQSSESTSSHFRSCPCRNGLRHSFGTSWRTNAIPECHSSSPSLWPQITEEAVFRGVILRGLLGHTRPAVAIGISALLFAFIHVNPWQFFGSLALGVLFRLVVRANRFTGARLDRTRAFQRLAAFSPHTPFDIPGFTAPHDSLSSPVHQPLWFTLAGAGLLVTRPVLVPIARHPPRRSRRSSCRQQARRRSG